MALSALGALKALEMYDISAYETLCRKVIVGNEDFIHKGEMGYYSYTGYWNGDVPKNDFSGGISVKADTISSGARSGRSTIRIIRTRSQDSIFGKIVHFRIDISHNFS